VAIVLLVFLAVAIERAVEIVLAPFEGRHSTAVRRFFAMVMASALAVAIAFGLGLDLVSPLLNSETGEATTVGDRGRALTAIALAGGSAPVHELIRLIEEAKARAKTPAITPRFQDD
jgi:hypothetical protein